MTGEVERRQPTAYDIARITEDYNPIRVAGMWVTKPSQSALTRRVWPFLALSQSKNHIPIKAKPLFRYDAGDTSADSLYPFPRIEESENQALYDELSEKALVSILGFRRNRKRVRVWLHRRVNPLGLHPPILEALDTYMQETGVDWRSDSLKETDINKNFATYVAPVPEQQVTLELGGPTLTVPAAAVVASGLRLAMRETLMIQDFRDELPRLQQAHPDLFG